MKDIAWSTLHCAWKWEFKFQWANTSAYVIVQIGPFIVWVWRML